MEYHSQVKVTGIQHFPDGREDCVEYITSGTLVSQPEGRFKLIYEEPANGESDKVKTLVSVEGEKVTTHRWGEPEYKLEYEAGKVFEGLYKVPYGVWKIKIVTHNLEYNLTAHEGRIRLKYDLFIEGNNISRNSMEIIIKEAH